MKMLLLTQNQTLDRGAAQRRRTLILMRRGGNFHGRLVSKLSIWSKLLQQLLDNLWSEMAPQA